MQRHRQKRMRRWLAALLKLFLYYVHLCTIIIYIMDFDKILMEVRGGKKSMQFAERMDRFGEGIFSKLLEIKRQKEERGETVIDLGVGAPNIPPARQSFWRRQPSGMRGATA